MRLKLTELKTLWTQDTSFWRRSSV